MGTVVSFPVIARPPQRNDEMDVVRASYDMRAAMVQFAQLAIKHGQTEYAVRKIESEAQELVVFLIRVMTAK